MKRNAIVLPETPSNHVLEKAFLSTFDLDENLLADLIDSKDADKYLIMRGDGEYVPLNDDSPIESRIIDVFFDLTDKKLPNGKYQPIKYHHAKIWFFLYAGPNGEKTSKLVIQSRNLYPYNSVETVLSFSGNHEKEKQSKNEPLVAYFESLLPFLTGKNKEFVLSIIDELPHHRFELDNGGYEAEDFEFVTPSCKDIPLLKEEYDELVVIAPFINVETINSLLKKKKEGGRCIVFSQPKIIESLIISDVKGVQYLSPILNEQFVHAKTYLVRKGDVWDLYAGSMNLSDYSIEKNIEAMVHLKNVRGIESAEGFLNKTLGFEPKRELEQYSIPKAPGFVLEDAYSIETRIDYIQKLLRSQKHEEEYMHEVSSYLFSSKSAEDLSDLAELRRELIPTRHQVITGKDKKRYVYTLPFEEKTLLSLLNYALHKHDRLFSQSVYLHILNRSVDGAFAKIHRIKDLKDYFLFKTDIHDFDPSINKGILCAQIDKLFHFDEGLCRFIKAIINERRFRLEGEEAIYSDDIIHQTGLPLGGFFENVYLYDFDFIMEKAPLYLRCGDDILIASKDKEEIEHLSKMAISLLQKKKLAIGEKKTLLANPGEKVFYLGWDIVNGEVDFTEESLKSIQKAIRKKTKTMLIMYGQRKVPNALRLPSIIRYVTHYQKSEFFLEAFQRVTTDKGLRKIDGMVMDLIRTVVSGKTGNSKYRIRYSTIQAFGYKSLVNRYYDYISRKK